MLVPAEGSGSRGSAPRDESGRPAVTRGGVWQCRSARTNIDLLGWSPLEAEWPPMRDKCVELDKKFEHCERIAASITDQFTIDRIKMLIEELRARKAGLHT